MKMHFIILGTLLVILTNCSESNIDKWNAKGYVWFTAENNDFTFRNQPEVKVGDSYLVPIPLSVATTVSDRDRIVNVEIIRQPEDNRTKYEVQTPVKFRAGHIIDTLFVKVTNSEHLNSVHDTITLQLLPSEDFDLGLNNGIKTNLCLFNGFSKPDWWTRDCESYFGYFSSLKMEIYFNVVGHTDDPTKGEGEWWDSYNVLWLCVVLNDYVAEHSIVYPDDDPNAPGKAPLFDWGSY